MMEFNFFGEDAKFHHIGMAVRSIEDVSPLCKPITDPIQKVRVALVSLNGIYLELIEPHGQNSPIVRSLEKGIKLVHLCYVVADIKKTLRTCRKYGFHCIKRPVPAMAFENREIAWVYSNQFGLFELLKK